MELETRLSKLKHDDKIAINDYGIMHIVQKEVERDRKYLLLSAFIYLGLGMLYLRDGGWLAWFQIGIAVWMFVSYYIMRQKIYTYTLLNITFLMAISLLWSALILRVLPFRITHFFMLLFMILQFVQMMTYYHRYRQWSGLHYETVEDEIRLYQLNLYSIISSDFGGHRSQTIQVHAGNGVYRIYLSHTGSLINLPREERVWFDLEQTLDIQETEKGTEFTVYVMVNVQHYTWYGWMERRDFERYQAWLSQRPVKKAIS